MANGTGGLLQRMNDIANHYDAINKWARTTPEQEWRETVRSNPSPRPPYGLPPYVFVKMGFDMDPKQLERQVVALYKRRAKVPEFAEFLYRPIPRDTPIKQITFVGPDSHMGLNDLAQRAVDARITMEEAVDFPNNLAPEQLASLIDHASDVGPDLKNRIAEAVEKQWQTSENEAEASERARIIDLVVSTMSREGAVDNLIQSDIDLFSALYGTLMTEAENSDIAFESGDLSSMWNEILDSVVRMQGRPLGSSLTVESKSGHGDLKQLWANVLDEVREVGRLVIDQPRRFPDEGPSPAKQTWDMFVRAFKAARAQPTYSEGLEALLNELGVTPEDRAEMHSLLSELDYIYASMPTTLRNIGDANVRSAYRRAAKEYSEDMLNVVARKELSVQKAAVKAQEYRNVKLVEARKKGSEAARLLSEYFKEEGKSLKDLQHHYATERFDKPFRDLNSEQKADVFDRIVKSSGRTNKYFNVLAEVSRGVGGGLLLLTAVVAMHEIAMAESKTRESMRQAALAYGSTVAGRAAQIEGARFGTAIGAALVRALGGAAQGSRATAAFGWVGAVAGAVIGGIAGFLAIDFLVPSESDLKKQRSFSEWGNDLTKELVIRSQKE